MIKRNLNINALFLLPARNVFRLNLMKVTRVHVVKLMP